MVQVTAHRGFSSKYPENTLLSIKKAIELGVDAVEIDVWLSLDHRVIVMHNRKLDHTTNGKGRIALKTFDQIRKLHIKKCKQPIPVLEEVFPLLKKGTRLNIDIKSIWAAKSVTELIKKYDMQDKVMVSSSNAVILNIVKKELPSLKTAYIFFASPYSKWAYFVVSVSKLFFKLTYRIILWIAKSARVDAVHLCYVFATRSFIKKLKKRGYKVRVWDVNTTALMKKLIKRKVDGIITDHPERLKKLLRAKPKSKKRFGLLRRRKRK